jgi:hypothetical protein
MIDKKLNNFDYSMYLCIKFLGKVILFSLFLGKQHYERIHLRFLVDEQILLKRLVE